MKQRAILIIAGLLLFTSQCYSQYPPFTKWYQNPLGFKPVNLHTVSGIIIPAVAAGVVFAFTKNDSTLHNRVSWYSDIGVSFGYYGSYTNAYQNNIGILFRARKYMAIGAEFTTYHVADNINNTWGFGIRPFVRFYPVQKEKFSLFFQSGAGLIWFGDNFPKPSGFFGDNREGTQWNGSPRYGIGTEFAVNKKLSASVGLWHVHISNGNNPGYERNPGHDSNGFSFGLVYRPISK